MKKITIILALILFGFIATSQNLTLNKLKVKDSIILTTKGIKFADGSYLLSAVGVGDTIMTTSVSYGHGFVMPKYSNYPYISTDSGYAQFRKIFVRLIGSNSGSKQSYMIGENGCPSTIVGTGNNMFGFGAGMSVGTSSNCNIIGYLAGASLYSGNGNVFNGARSGYYTNSAGFNTFSGYYSGYNNTSGAYNAYYGNFSGFYLTTNSYGIIFNTMDRGTAKKDTTHSPIFIHQNSDTAHQNIYLNGNVNIRGNLTIHGLPVSGGGATMLSQLTDVNPISANPGDVLTWNDDHQLWEPTPPTGSFSPTIATPLNDDILAYYNGVWKNMHNWNNKAGSAYTYSDYDLMANQLFDYDSTLWLDHNGNVINITGKLTVNHDTVFHKSDTARTGTNGLVTKHYADGRYALKSSVGGGSSKWVYASGSSASSYILPDAGKKIIASTLYSSDSLVVFDYHNGNIFVSKSTNKTYIGTRNIIMGDGENGKYLGAGNDNTSIGYGSGARVIDGNRNVHIGYIAGNTDGYYSTSNDNIAIGTGALADGIPTNERNVAVGYSAGRSITTGGYNNFIGNYSGYYLTTQSYWTILNNRDNGSASNDTIKPPFVSYQNTTVSGSRIRLNAGVVTLPQILLLTPIASAPASPIEGMIYTGTDHHVYYYNGTTWKQLDN